MHRKPAAIVALVAQPFPGLIQKMARELASAFCIPQIGLQNVLMTKTASGAPTKK
jgi:hypothetical protein